jgi:hypothetical protein
MEFYKPSQRLSFYYSVANNAVYIKSYMNVYLPPGESLATMDTQVISSLEYGMKYNYVLDVSANQEYMYDHVVYILILKKVPFTYDPKNVAAFKDKLTEYLTNNLSQSPSAFYSVTVTVYKKDGSKGGQATNTLSSQGDIEIG